MSDQAIPPTPPLVTDALMARGLAENRSLPPGWKAVYSHFDTAFYYWHLESGHAQWTPPTQCRPTAMAAPTTTTATAASSNSEGSLTAGEGNAWSGSLITAAVHEHAASAMSASPASEEAVHAVEAERVGREGSWV